MKKLCWLTMLFLVWLVYAINGTAAPGDITRYVTERRFVTYSTNHQGNGTGGSSVTPTIAIGTVTTGLPGSTASVINVGTPTAAVLNMTIPQGLTGNSGTGAGDMQKSSYDPNNVNSDAFSLNSHTGSLSADKLVDGTANKVFTSAEKSKLGLIAAGATANSTDAQLRDRSTHTGTQPWSSITGAPTITGSNTGDVTIGTGNGLTIAGQILSLAPASISQTGALTLTDWNTFNNKLGPSAIGTSVQAYNSNLTSFAGITPTANVLSLLNSSNYATFLALLSTATITDLNHLHGVTSGVQGQIDGKQSALGYTPVPQTRTVNGLALTGDINITNVSGNSGTATALQTGRTINGVTFDGTANITLPLAPVDNPTFTTGITTPAITINSPDGSHYVQPYNGVTFDATPSEGMIQTTSTSVLWYHNGSWVSIAPLSVGIDGGYSGSLYTTAQSTNGGTAASTY